MIIFIQLKGGVAEEGQVSLILEQVVHGLVVQQVHYGNIVSEVERPRIEELGVLVLALLFFPIFRQHQLAAFDDVFVVEGNGLRLID